MECSLPDMLAQELYQMSEVFRYWNIYLDLKGSKSEIYFFLQKKGKNQGDFILKNLRGLNQQDSKAGPSERNI